MKTLNYEDLDNVVPKFGRSLEEGRTTSTTVFKLDRRQFLKLSGMAGGGLMLSFATRRVLASTGPLNPNGYVHIDADGIRIYAKNPEIGQGVKTSLPMIVAEELDAAWSDVTVIQSVIDQTKYGAQFAGGSLSIPMNYDALRRAGATARAMLVQAAANQWGVAPSELATADSKVIDKVRKRALSYTELADQAATLPVPESSALQLKSKDDFKLLGKRITGVDNEELVRGEPLFGIDVRLPGMKYAVYQKCPAIGGKVVSANIEEVKALPGVHDAFVLQGNGNAMELLPGVAIVADSTWQAMQAKQKLKVEWDENEASKDSWSGATAQAKEIAQQPGPQIANTGDVDAAFEASDKQVSGFYSYHFVSHANLEPQNCTASYVDGKLDLYAPTQTPGQAIQSAANVAQVPPTRVTLHQQRCGGGFGRRLYNDFVCEAAAISRRVKLPVKLQWTREDDMAYDLFRAGGFHQMDGSIDAEGKITGWRDRFITFSHDGRRPVSGGSMSGGVFPGGLLPNLRIEQTALEWSNRCGAWRAPGSNVFGFAVMSFLDELAHAAGRDPLEVLLETLGTPRQLGPRGMHTGRAAGVVKLAAEKAGWGQDLGSNRGLGIGFYFSHAGHIAEVADVSVDDAKRIKIHKITVAADVGPIVNLSGAENQMQGSVIDGLSTSLGLSVTFENGRVEQSNFHRYPLLRMSHAPVVDVHFIDSDYPPTGLGEPGLPPLAPAVCNAVFAATGHRIRTMPWTDEGFSIA